MNVQGIDPNENHKIKARTSFFVQPLHGQSKIKVNGLILKTLASILPSKYIIKTEWEHIFNLPLADPHFNEPGHIDMLLGADVFNEIILDGVKRGKNGTPVAQNTIFGWILSGKINQQVGPEIIVKNFHLCATLETQLKTFWEIEEINNQPLYNEEELQCEEIYTKTTKRLPNGQYEVQLPLKLENHKNFLGKSRNIAIKRLYQMENKFKKDQDLEKKYATCINEYALLNHMKLAEKSEDEFINNFPSFSSCSCSYLPHHGVIKESSTTTKLRVVFDASRTTESGTSLNDMMLKGPVVQDDLCSILIRWRKHKIAFTADIEKMYRQIRVYEKHTELQRILWRDSPNQQIKDYKLLTVTFGTKSAPYLATRTLKQLALDDQHKFPIASKITLNDFYVDDVLSGADTISDALKAQNELLQLMESAKFPLRKWSTNSSELLKDLPAGFREMEFPYVIDKNINIKTLGITWNPIQDICMYSINLNNNINKWSKRLILSEISKLFDPLGLLAPIIIIAKIFIQKLWLSGLDWDAELNSDLENEWVKYFAQIEFVRDIYIPRWIQHSTNDATVEIHGFADASMKAYAAVIYICTTDNLGNRTVSLIASKTKVAPIKVISLPRLELCAAVLVAKLTKFVCKALQISNTIQIYGWSDSEIVLAWLRAHPSKWTTFIANRISYIHEILGENVWAHVPSKQNPADCASRGMYPLELQQHEMWWKGPMWLQKGKEFWPIQKVITTNLEERRISNHHIHTFTLSSEFEFEIKFSTWTRLLRVTAYCLRFISNSKNHIKKYGPLSSLELQHSQLNLIKRAQMRNFDEEIKLLKNSTMKSKNKLSTLNPFIDSQGVLRVGGRLTNSSLSYNEKHPIILPSSDHITKLLILKFHIETLHGGPQLMMTVIRRNYWIIRARTLIKDCVHKCIPCFKQKTIIREQLMGDLPTPRVQITRPFFHTGVDYCGPFQIKMHKGRNSKTYKSYISLFICMATKAIHLELVTDLTAQGFIAAFKRFSARRGMASEIYCDCGTNFIGAEKILQKDKNLMLNNLNIDIVELLANEGVNFHFNPPASPHFGGLWEAGVKSTKFHLKRVLGNSLLTFEELYTVLTQVEACLNSRPLCELSNDPQDTSPLTPAHFLIGDLLITPPEPSLLNLQINRLDRWQYLQKLYQDFWSRWSKEYLSRLQQRPKWKTTQLNVNINDLVIVKNENLPPSRWLLARVIDVHPGTDGLVRVVTLKTKDTTLKRPITKICLLPIN